MRPVTKGLALWLCTFALAGANAIAAQAQALSGLLQLSTDSAGNFAGAQIWNTRGGDAAWNLYVIQGASGPFINSGDAAGTAINVPLVPGTYTFTLNAESNPGLGSVSFVGLNLFFDGSTGTPGISVFAPINTTGGSPNGGSTRDLTAAITVPGANTLTTTSNGMRITLSSFRFNSPTTIDLVSPYDNVPSGTTDFVTTFTLTVAPVAAPTAAPVPTQAEWILILMIGLVGVSGAYALSYRRRR